MPVFSPPTAADLPMILPETRGIQYRLWRYYGGNPRGRSVVKIAGHYTTIDVPTTTQLVDAGEEGTDWFLGGHLYVVTDAVGTALLADGYSVDVPGTWGSYSSTPWGELSSDFWAGT